MGDYLQERLDEAFPSSADAQLVRAVQQGILLADDVTENQSWLQGAGALLGRDVRGYLRRAAILSRVHAACEAGDLPFEAVISAMPRGPFHWVEIASGGFKAHICRTESAGAFPEETPTRQDERLPNPQADLFETNVVSLRDAASALPNLFAWLSFGVPHGAELGHLCWAMPDNKGESWLAHTNVLYRLAVADIKVEPESPPERATIKFKEQIEEALKKPDNAARSED